ncbi:efflux transporter outer membrane subunit [Rhizobium paknamense]|uniref:NodT family efflux transporter outer membrane factor (OMF) lipoprotein n=1 Tax=Rhizobium paknamense TaxID=1206817 RepID=A0ABU0IHU5_9HYPH|nr:efflux transporter outer membrane subunit [Rhizobium paknamense]MDQ0456774.1 NodT family efflux transporter outer membrane factor (OMF) lipoprotein [Rhizobium paknamense]
MNVRQPCSAFGGLRPGAHALGLLTVLLGGCTAGPDFNPPDAPKVEGYTKEKLGQTAAAQGITGGQSQRFAVGSDVNPAWWTLFNSKQINAFVEEAVRNHPDVASAQYALRAARETALAEQGGLFPQVSASGTSTRERSSASGGTPASIYTLHNASVDVSYSLDLFGGTRRQIEAKWAAADYQRFQLEATYLSLTANVVTAALTDASLQAQIAATEDIVRLQQDQLTRIQRQFALGAVPASDVLSQQSTLAQTQATLPSLQKQRAQQRNALMAYLGRLPNQDRGESVNLASLSLPRTLPVSLPSSLVRQRPDIRAAEATLHEATASVGVAIANMLPQVSLSASYGSNAGSPGKLFSAETIAWTVAASVSQKLVDGGTLYHTKEASVATFEQDLATYKSTVISAFQNVADSLRAIQYDAKALQADMTAEKASHDSLIMAQEQYKTGAVDYPTVSTAQQTYQNAVITRVKAQATRYTDTVALYQSLGGGWWNRDDQTEQAYPRIKPGHFAGPAQSAALSSSTLSQNKKVQTQ